MSGDVDIRLVKLHRYCEVHALQSGTLLRRAREKLAVSEDDVPVLDKEELMTGPSIRSDREHTVRLRTESHERWQGWTDVLAAVLDASGVKI